MRFAKLLAGALLLALCPAGAAQARDQFRQTDTVTIDPQRAYIFYRSARSIDVRFMREVDAAEQAAWEAERQEGFTQALERNRRRIAAWDREIPQCRSAGDTAYCRNRGARPEPLTLETFAFAPPELDNFVVVSGGRRFTRTETENGYLIAVDPGTWAVYGQAEIVPSGTLGICLCMGSVRFEARAGQIVDIGEIRFPRIEARRNGGDEPRGRLASMTIVPPSDAMAQPEQLAGLPVVRADLRAAGKVPNYFALEIARMEAIPGVLAYRRDTVIDVKAQSEAGETAGR